MFIEKKPKLTRINNSHENKADNLPAGSPKTKFTVTNFFYNLLNTKPPKWKTASDKDRLTYLAKYYSAVYFFEIGNSYHSFISWITQYYPFSLLYRERLFHHKNLKVGKLMDKITNTAGKANINISILSGTREKIMAELIANLDKKPKDKATVLNNLENALQKKYGTIYVRGKGKKVRILIPNLTFESIINHV